MAKRELSLLERGYDAADKDWPQLLMDVYRLYREKQVGVLCSYDSFARDIVSDDTYTDATDAVSENAHNINHNRLAALMAHRSLVRKYFDKYTFTKADCKALDSEFSHLSDEEPDENCAHLPSFRCYLTDNQISAITDTANAQHIFTHDVSADDIKRLFNCTLSHTLQSSNNRILAVFFDELSKERIICRQWQNVLTKRQYVLSSKTGKPLQRANLSVALSDETSGTLEKPEITAIRKMARDVARMRENADNEP